MTIQRWARWIEFGQGDLDRSEALDIHDVPALCELFRNKFFQGDKEDRLYSNLFELVQEYLPVPQLGYRCERDRQAFYRDGYTKGFCSRLEILPIRDGNIFMTAQEFRVALIGKKALNHHGGFYQSIFYNLELEQKKYILQRQPDLFPFRTNLIQKIGSGSLLEVLLDYSSKDLLIDAALFGSDALLKAIEFLKTMVLQFCIEESDTFEKIFSFYPALDKKSLACSLINHQIDIIKKRAIDDDKLLELVDLINTYCSQKDSEIELTNLLFPTNPIKRASVILAWLKNTSFKSDVVHLPLSAIARFICAQQLELGPLDLDPSQLMDEFDFLMFEEKKEFLTYFLLENVIEVLPNQLRLSFLVEVEKRHKEPLNILFKLALLSSGFVYTNLFGHKVSILFHHGELINEIQNLDEINKKWLLENFITHKSCLVYFFKSNKLFLFFNIINELKSYFDSDYLSSLNTLIEEKILEYCPNDCADLALSFLGGGYKLATSLKKYIFKKIACGSFDETLFLICKKFFESDEIEIDFLLHLAIYQFPSGEFLINDPNFFLAVPDKFKEDVSLILDLIKPVDPNSLDPLISTLKMLPKGLKEVVVKENTFSFFFQKEVMNRLLNLYNAGCIPDEEMFFLASSLPYETFKQINDKLAREFSGFNQRICFASYESTIDDHLKELCQKITFGDPYSEEDLSKFINAIAHLSIGEGRWIQYLACRVPSLFNEADAEKILHHIPMNLIPYIAHIIDPLHRNWLLNTRFEAVFSKNIDKLSIEVRSWLFDNLNKWFPICEDIIEKIQGLWQLKRKSFEQKLEIFEETQTLLILFDKRCTQLHTICQRLAKKPDAEKARSVYQQLDHIKSVVSQWLTKIDAIDLSPISDALTQDILKGDVYSLEGNGWILKKTKERLKENPFNRSVFKSENEKNERVPPLSLTEVAELKQRRLMIASELESFRVSVLSYSN
jgi:hypothetical protein